MVGAGSCWPHDRLFFVGLSSFVSELVVADVGVSIVVASGEMVFPKSNDSGVIAAP